ncbi:MAG: hydrolase [Leptospiraceae bacterium]|nr:MAG: hydrolase [Leptospiraceae bacterium]
MVWNLYNATYVDSYRIKDSFDIYIKNDKILLEYNESDLQINLHGRTILPSFINSFDNLLATYLAYEGKNFPYYNWLMWDNELKSSSLFEERMLLDREDLYFLGSYKNIISGVTFVIDPIPKFVFEDLIEELDIDLLQDFGISHSPVSYALNWGKGIKEEFEYAKQKNLPFIIRVGEGFDTESKNSIRILKELNALDRNTVLIHGISLNKEDIELIKEYDCSFVWVPEVNEYIYGKTAPIDLILEKEIRVCLGSGSSMYGSLNLLSTLKTAHKYISDSKVIFKMILDNPVEAFFLKKDKILTNNSEASFIIIDKISPENHDFIWDLDLNDILLVVHKGVPIYGSSEFLSLFEYLEIPFEELKIKKKHRLIKKGFTKKFNEILFKIGKIVQFPFLPVEFD